MNAVEIGVLHPTQCSITRMQFESYVLLARVLALVAPWLGVVLALVGLSGPGRMRWIALGVNLAALLLALGVSFHLVPQGHLPCLRN